MYDAASTGSSLAVDTARTSPARRTGKTARSPWNRRNPYPATVVRNELLSGPGSAKEVRHLELDLGDSGITYEPGDGIGIAPTNDPALVDLLLGFVILLLLVGLALRAAHYFYRKSGVRLRR